MRPCKGGGSQYPISLYCFKIKKTSHTLKINMANIPKISYALYPISRKLIQDYFVHWIYSNELNLVHTGIAPMRIQVSCFPLNIYNNVPYPFIFLCQYHCIPKNPSRASTMHWLRAILYMYVPFSASLSGSSSSKFPMKHIAYESLLKPHVWAPSVFHPRPS